MADQLGQLKAELAKGIPDDEIAALDAGSKHDFGCTCNCALTGGHSWVPRTARTRPATGGRLATELKSRSPNSTSQIEPPRTTHEEPAMPQTKSPPTHQILEGGTIVPVEQPRPTDPLSMAIERGMDADGIAKIVGLVRERERDEAEKAFSESVRSVSELAAPIVKSKKGNKSNYAPLEEVNRALVPLYTAAGLSLSFSETDCPFAEKGWKRHVCDVRHIKGHKERYHLDVPLDNADGKNPGMNPIQSAISTGSYVQRVLLCRIFNVTIAESDVDGQSLSDLLLITPEQLADVKDLIVQNEMDEAALLKWLKAESLEKITRAQFEKFQTTYRQRKAKAS